MTYARRSYGLLCMTADTIIVHLLIKSSISVQTLNFQVYVQIHLDAGI